MDVERSIVDDCIEETHRTRHALRGEDGRMVEDPGSFYRQLASYFQLYRMGRTDHLSDRFGKPIPTVRAAMQNVRGRTGEDIRTLEQPQGGHGLYYKAHEDPVGLLIRNPDALRAAKIPKELLLPLKAADRVAIMLELGVVKPDSRTADILRYIAEEPLSIKELARKVAYPDLNIANIFNTKVRPKLPLFGVRLGSQAAGKFGLGKAQAYSLEPEPVRWDWDEVYIECDRKIEALFKENWGHLVAFAKKQCGREEEAQELVQNVFTSFLFRSRREPREMLGRLHLSFVFEAIKKRSTEGVRTAHRRGDHLSFDEGMNETYSANDYGTPSPTPEFILEAYDTRNQLLAALAEVELTAEQRETMDLHYVHGLSSSAIAEKLQTSLRTVQHRLHRARTELKIILGEKFFR